MSAELLFHRKNIEPNGDIIEMKILLVPKSKDKPHGLKYSLAYIHEGTRIVGYDNAEVKGDHKHYRNKEYSYQFKGVYKLIEDFYTDVERIKRGEL